MIREERNPLFWERIASHPACADALMGIAPEHFAAEAVGDLHLPLAAEHGGFIFVPRDAFGRMVELHTLFTPEGWGREVSSAAKQAFNWVFETYDLVVTFERCSDWRTRPPRSFGFKPCGDAFEMLNVTWRTWQLSKHSWQASPAFQRMTH